MNRCAITYRDLGHSAIRVTAVGLGCWPIAGMTSLGVNQSDSVKTIEAALEAGINHLDTAYCYGSEGESECLIGRAMATRPREDVIIASKAGVHWDTDGRRVIDGRHETLTRQGDESLLRLGIDHVDVLYLHAPDPKVDIAESAGALCKLKEQGKTREVGASNVTLSQLQRFSDIIRPAVVQLPFNMLQQSIRNDLIPWCIEQDIAISAYWPLMKGLLAGRLRRGHTFDPADKRLTYPMYQGTEWQQNQDFIDDLESISRACETTVAALVIAWTISQPGITVALCGAKRAWQIRETAAALRLDLGSATLSRIDEAIKRRLSGRTQD